jgi:hypothetical protein
MRRPRLKKVPKKKFEPRTVYAVSERDANLPKVGSFEQENKYLEEHAAILFKEILAGKKKIAFDVAFFLLKGFETWKEEGLGHSLKQYLEGLLKIGKCMDKYKSFQMAYHVADVFGNLVENENRKASFECYRKIAHAKLFFNNSLTSEDNRQKNKFWQEELRREVEGANVIRSDFEGQGLDYENIVPKLIQKGYVTQEYFVSLAFKEFDDEFKSWFPQYTTDQFDAIKEILEYQLKTPPKSLTSSKLIEKIKEVRKRNGVYAIEEQDSENSTIPYYNIKLFFDKFKERFNPEFGDKYKIERVRRVK